MNPDTSLLVVKSTSIGRFFLEVMAGILSSLLLALLVKTVAMNWHFFIRLLNSWRGEREDERRDHTVSSVVAREVVVSIEGERPCSDPGIMGGTMGSVREQEMHFVNCDMPSTRHTVSSVVAREVVVSIEGERPCSDPGIMGGTMGSVGEQEKHFVNSDMPSTSHTVSSVVAREVVVSIEGEKPCIDPGIMGGTMGSVREQEKHFVNCDIPSSSLAASIDPTQESDTPSTNLVELAHPSIDCDTLDLGKRSEIYENDGTVGIVDEELGLS